MAIRKILHIDEDKCNGCGLCVPSCAEGAIKIIDGKARLVSDNLCDGLGACLGDCPLGAIKLIEREAEEFDEEAVKVHLGETKEKKMPLEMHAHGGGCPGSKMKVIHHTTIGGTVDVNQGDVEIKIKSQLQQWPVQLALVPPTAPYFEDADMLVTADCVPFAYPNYHLEILKGKKVVIGCPKLDNVDAYVQKLVQIIKFNHIKSVTVAFMEVPCCTGIVRAVERAVQEAGKETPLHRIRISIEGEADRI